MNYTRYERQWVMKIVSHTWEALILLPGMQTIMLKIPKQRYYANGYSYA